MTATIELKLSEDNMRRLEIVADYQGKDVADVAELATRLYLQRFKNLINEEGEK